MRNSYWMELEGLKRSIALLTNFGIPPTTLITDRHKSISAYIKNELTDTIHYHDIWHVAKGLNTLVTVSFEYVIVHVPVNKPNTVLKTICLYKTLIFYMHRSGQKTDKACTTARLSRYCSMATINHQPYGVQPQHQMAMVS